MAATDLGGYDCNFVEQPSDDLICLICTFVAKDPQQLTCCGKIYCRACLQEHKKHSPTCPQCRGRGESFEDKKSDRSIKQLRVKCTNAHRGCQWIGELGTLTQHSTGCPYTLVICPNRCMYKNKRVKKLFKDLHQHLQSECPNRLTTRSKILCTNEGCRCCIARDELFAHRDECAFERVHCKYAHTGCTTELLRKDIETHENNTQLHQYYQLTGYEHIFTEKNEPTAQPHFTFALTNFNYLKNKDMAFYSSPFHTKHGGYKLCLRVDTNGWATGHCTHVSVQLHLMRGDNDHLLQWPFVGRVTVTLLNQLQDDRHHQVTFEYINQRVIGRGQRSALGYGPLRYISHSALGYNSDLNRQYLKDDCLFFRVTVDAPPPMKQL